MFLWKVTHFLPFVSNVSTNKGSECELENLENVNVGTNYFYFKSSNEGIYEILVVREGIESIAIQESQKKNPAAEFSFDPSILNGQEVVVSRYGETIFIDVTYYKHTGTSMMI